MGKVSIIIPVYNVEHYITQCLQSVLGQSYSDIEVILVDDCSPDRSIEVALDFISSHPRKDVVRILHQERNQGQSCARNTGIKAATGDYVYFLDSDDYIAPDTIALLVDAMEHNDIDLAISGFDVVGDNRFPRFRLPFGSILKGDEIINSLYREEWHVMPWNKLLRLDFIKKNNLYFVSGIIHEDDLWTFILATKIRSMMAIEGATYFYVVHDEATTGRVTMRHFNCRIKVIELIAQYLTANPELQTTAVLSLFERFKMLYMRNIHNKMHNSQCDRKLYDVIRDNRIVRGDIKLYPTEHFLSLGYKLPRRLGYWHYLGTIMAIYKMMMLKLKLGIA